MDLFKEFGEFIGIFLGTHLVTLLGFTLGILVMGHLIRERRRTSNIFAWFLLIVFMPFVGVVLYFLFGGTKSRYVLKNKSRVREYAIQVAEEEHPESVLVSARQYQFPYLSGNRFELLPDDVSCFEAICREIREAKESIYIMTYILGKDDVGSTIVDLLAKRAAEGVEVKLLIDAVGSLGKGGRFVDPIRKAGGRVARFMPVIPLQTKTSANLRNHRKMAIFDKRRVITGGQNLDRRFMGPDKRPDVFVDFSALIEGPSAALFNRHFISDWCFATRDPIENFRDVLKYHPGNCGEIPMRVIPSGPDMRRDTIWETLLVLIQECREEVTVVTPYFLPDDVILASLAVKAHAGRKITLILPEHSNQRMVDRARYHHLRRLHEEGVDIRFYQPGMVHAKLFIVDGKTAMIGSANMDIRSLFVNFEIGLVVGDEGTVGQLQAWADKLLMDCEPFDTSEKAKPTIGRVFLEDVAYLMMPLL